jgi:hypothetical protein
VFVSRNFLLRRLLQDSWLYIIITCIFFSFSFVCIQYYYCYYYILYYSCTYLIRSFDLTHYYCIIALLLFVYLHCAVSVIGLVAVDSAHK